jgi:hypothetical protein
LRLPAYSASAKVICFIGKLGGWGRGILPNQKVFFRVSLSGKRQAASGKRQAASGKQNRIRTCSETLKGLNKKLHLESA